MPKILANTLQIKTANKLNPVTRTATLGTAVHTMWSPFMGRSMLPCGGRSMLPCGGRSIGGLSMGGRSIPPGPGRSIIPPGLSIIPPGRSMSILGRSPPGLLPAMGNRGGPSIPCSRERNPLWSKKTLYHPCIMTHNMLYAKATTDSSNHAI